MLRPGGRLAALDAAEPEQRRLRGRQHVWFRRVVPFLGGVLCRHDGEAYRYLPESTAYLPPPSSCCPVDAAGFDVEQRTFTGGAVQLITGTLTMTAASDAAGLVARTRAVDGPAICSTRSRPTASRG